MIALAPALQSVSPAPGPATGGADEDEVVVIGERLRRWAGTITSNPLGTRCRTTESTGDAAIDAIGCDAMTTCWPDAKRGLRQAHDRHLAAVERDRLQAATRAAFSACSLARRRVLIADRVAHGLAREGQYR